MDEIETIRKEIDKIDKEISKQLKKRLIAVKKIGDYKKSIKVPIKDKKREEEILLKFETEFEKNVFRHILRESKKTQE